MQRPPDDDHDRDLLARHVAGDPDAFAELARRHRERLWAVAVRTLGDREEAADALQDALLSAHRAAGGFRAEARVTTWLHRIVVNACLDRVRRSAARPTVPLPEDRDPAAPGDDLDRRVTSLTVTEALARLPVDLRTAVVLVDLEGMGVAEAAEVLGVPVGTVKSRCSRGRARLAVMLSSLDPGNRPAAHRVGPETPGPSRDAQEGSTP